MFPNGMTWWEAFLLTGQPWWNWPGWGFRLFGAQHLLWLALCAILITLLVKRYAKMPKGDPRRRRMLLVVGIFPQCSLALTNFLCASQGLYDSTRLPLYLCNVCELLILIDTLHPNSFCGECAFALSIVCGAVALLFPGWHQCPAWNIMSVTGFAEHSCLVAFPLMRLASGEVKPRWQRIWMPLVTVVAYGCAIIPYNLAFGSNFGFIPDPMGTQPLEGIYQLLGNPLYTLLVFLCACAGIAGEYAIFELTLRKARQS